MLYDININEWGPARHDPDHPASPQKLQYVRDHQWDIDELRPDDN